MKNLINENELLKDAVLEVYSKNCESFKTKITLDQFLRFEGNPASCVTFDMLLELLICFNTKNEKYNVSLIDF